MITSHLHVLQGIVSIQHGFGEKKNSQKNIYITHTRLV